MKKKTNILELLLLMIFLDLDMLYEFHKSGKLGFALLVLFIGAMNLWTIYFFRREWKNRAKGHKIRFLNYRVPCFLVNLNKENDDIANSRAGLSETEEPEISYYTRQIDIKKLLNYKSFSKALPFLYKKSIVNADFYIDDSGFLIIHILTIDELAPRKSKLFEKHLKCYLEKQFSRPLPVTDLKKRKRGVVLSNEAHELKIEKYPCVDDSECLELLKQQTLRKALRIKEAEEKPELLDSKLGGWPYLPIGENRPKDSYGHPMGLLIQLNFKQMNLDDFPKEGIFEVFCSDRDSGPFEYAVRYYQNDQLPAQPFDGYYLKGFLHQKENKIEFESCDCYMDEIEPHYLDAVKRIIKQQANFEIHNIKDLGLCGAYSLANTVNWFECESLNPSCFVGGYCGFNRAIVTAEKEWTKDMINIVRMIPYESDYHNPLISMCVAIKPDDLKEGRLEKARVFYDYNSYFNDMRNE